MLNQGLWSNLQKKMGQNALSHGMDLGCGLDDSILPEIIDNGKLLTISLSK